LARSIRIGRTVSTTVPLREWSWPLPLDGSVKLVFWAIVEIEEVWGS
jgi:hypothetical protein